MTDPVYADTVYSIPFDGPPILDVSGPACILALVPTEPGEQPFLECDERMSALFKPVISREGDTVKIHLEFVPGGPWGGRRHAHGPFPFAFLDGPKAAFTLHVPSAVRARIHVDAGKVRVRGLAGGEIDLAASAGAFMLKNVDAKVKVRLGAGQVKGENLSGSFDVETNAGAVRLSITRLASGQHRVVSGMGAVRVALAPEQKVQVDARASMGAVRNQYPSTAGAEARLELATEVGSIRVEEGTGVQAEERGPGDWPGSWAGGHWARQARRWAGAQAWQWPNPWSGRGWAGQEPSPPRPPRTASDEEMLRILGLVKEGRITPEEAQKLLRALEQP